eukprot:157776-Chlamydomonas_euryale.AAC.7
MDAAAMRRPATAPTTHTTPPAGAVATTDGAGFAPAAAAALAVSAAAAAADASCRPAGRQRALQTSSAPTRQPFSTDPRLHRSAPLPL